MNTCHECGYIHPPSPDGKCPIASVQKVENEIKNNLDQEVSQGILDIKKDLLDKFKQEQQKSNCLSFIKKIRNFINNTSL